MRPWRPRLRLTVGSRRVGATVCQCAAPGPGPGLGFTGDWQVHGGPGRARPGRAARPRRADPGLQPGRDFTPSLIMMVHCAAPGHESGPGPGQAGQHRQTHCG